MKRKKMTMEQMEDRWAIIRQRNALRQACEEVRAGIERVSCAPLDAFVWKRIMGEWRETLQAALAIGPTDGGKGV